MSEATTLNPEVLAVGNRLVELCSAGQHREAMEELYADDVVSVEPMSMPGQPARQEGKDAIRGKHDWWESAVEMHSGETHGPYVHGDNFAVIFKMDCTFRESGQRYQMQEVAVYTVREGKIAHEEFYCTPCDHAG